MGNQNIKGLPLVFAKNWYQISQNPSIYRSKLTGEYVRTHIGKIKNYNQIEELKQRMKQTNPYICRIAFYHHYEDDDTYLIYTDETKGKFIIKHIDDWKMHKKKIAEAFVSLAKKYGYMRVCREMIGADNSNQIKVWISPDPILSEPWHPCSTQAQMMADIQVVCRNFEEQLIKQLKSKEQEHNTQNEINRFIYQSNKNLSIKFNNLKKFKSIEQDPFIKSENKISNCSPNKRLKHTCPPFIMGRADSDRFKVLNPTNVNELNNGNEDEDDFCWARSKTESFQTLQTEIEKSRKCSERLKRSQQQIPITNFNMKFEVRKCQQKTINIKEKKANHRKQKKKSNLEEIQKNLLQRPKYNRNRLSPQSTEKPERQRKSMEQRHASIEKDQPIRKLFLSRKFTHTYNYQSICTKQTQKTANMTKKLRNVAYMPVKQERESEIPLVQNRQQQNRQKKESQSTVDEDFIKFFDEDEKKQYYEVQQRIKEKSEKYSNFRRTITKLLSN